MKLSRLSALIAPLCVLNLSALPAYAQDTSVKALIERIEKLERELKALRESQEKQQSEQEMAAAPAEKMAPKTQPASKPMAPAPEHAPQIAQQPTPEAPKSIAPTPKTMPKASAPDTTEIEVAAVKQNTVTEIAPAKPADVPNPVKFFGLIQTELNLYDGAFNGSNGGSSGGDIFIRRTHFIASHRANDELDYVLLFFGSERNTNVLVGFARYQPTDNFELRVGRIKEDRTLSVAYIGEELPAERPMVINAFATAFQLGVQAHYIFDNGLRLSTGLFEDQKYAGNKDGRDDDGDFTLGYNLRGSWGYQEDGVNLHLGASYALRMMNNEPFSLTERTGIRNAEDRLSIAPTLDSAKHGQIYMTEFAWQYDAFRIEAEYGLMEVESATDLQQDLSLDGYYVTLSYFLDGETQRNYLTKYGQISRPTNENNVWEAYARYSTLDMADQGAGTDADVFMLGANYYWNKNWNMEFQLYHSEISGPGTFEAPFITEEGQQLLDANAFVGRVSYRF